MRAPRLLLASFLLLGCMDGAEAEGDAIDDCALCDGKADDWGAPAEGSCAALGILRVANEATFEALDVDAGLNRRAAEEIVAAREVTPLATLAALDAVPYVGVGTLSLLRDHAEAAGFTVCDGPLELGIISDLDKTVIPPEGDLGLPEAAYPGVATLYTLLERGADGAGAEGDTTYVTARTPDRIGGVTEWLAARGVPSGPIETGTSTLPWAAQPEKVRDISRVMDARVEQHFLLFGDSSHRDPEVYREVIARYPERVRAAFIHRVNATVSPARVEGLYLVDHYPEAAAILVGLGVLTEADARAVYAAAVEEGLALDEETFDALLMEHAR